MKKVIGVFIPCSLDKWLFLISFLIVVTTKVVISSMDMAYDNLRVIGELLLANDFVTWSTVAIFALSYAYFYVFAIYVLCLNLLCFLKLVRQDRKPKPRLMLLNSLYAFFSLLLLVPFIATILPVGGFYVWSAETQWIEKMLLAAGGIGWGITYVVLKLQDDQLSRQL